jgi:prepilin-type N-terminal cleavage/methylation domain-containing protein
VRSEPANNSCHGSRHPRAACAFTLIELLVVIAIIGVLLAVLLPALGAAREAGRASVCLSNHRQMHLICQTYADENKGYGPAIGQPYTESPNWAFVVQNGAGRLGSTSAEIYSKTSIIVCPTLAGVYAREMTRTYAMNATGHSGLLRPDGTVDPSNFDTPVDRLGKGALPAHIRFDLVDRPSVRVLFVDSLIDTAPATQVTTAAASTVETPSNVPPPTRTASVLDFRLPLHVQYRLARAHAKSNTQWAAFDGSAHRQPVGTMPKVPEEWLDPLP